MPRTDSVTVSINLKPEQVWDYVADIKNWKDFSEYGKNMEKVSPEEWIAHTEQGDIRVLPKFKKEQLVLDHLCILSNGEEVLIPYRVEPVGDASFGIVWGRPNYSPQVAGMNSPPSAGWRGAYHRPWRLSNSRPLASG